jgi:predicted aldo/keto reductase-like oxidoreductase
MSDRESTSIPRRDFLQTGAAATAAAVTVSSLAPAEVQAQTAAGKPKQPSARVPVLPHRRFGKTGVDVTILNAGTLRVAGFMDRLLRLAFSQGVRFFDTAKVYGTEPGFKKWFAEMPQVRKQIFLATKEPVRAIGDVLKNIDQRLEALGTDYIDLLYYHGLGRGQVDWARSREMRQEIDAIKKTGKVRFVGFTTHDGAAADQLKAAAEGGFVDAIMLSYAPWLNRDSALNKAMDACYEKQIGLVAMKLFAGRGALNGVFEKAPMLKERGLNPHQALLHAAWSDERLACVCTAMTNTDQVRQNVAAARKFEPMKQSQILELRDAVLAAGPMMCPNCDGSCARAGGTHARLGDLTRLLTYDESLGARVMAREEYAALSEVERDWRGADLEAARAACHSRLDFARLLPRVDRFLG